MKMGEGTVTIATILESVTTLVSSAVTWAGSFLSMITSNNVLLIFCVAVPLVGLGIGVIRRLTGIRM